MRSSDFCWAIDVVLPYRNGASLPQAGSPAKGTPYGASLSLANILHQLSPHTHQFAFPFQNLTEHY